MSKRKLMIILLSSWTLGISSVIYSSTVNSSTGNFIIPLSNIQSGHNKIVLNSSGGSLWENFILYSISL